MTVCDICKELTMNSITICNDCKRELEEMEQNKLDEYDEAL